jgi:hypothetical protein
MHKLTTVPGSGGGGLPAIKPGATQKLPFGAISARSEAINTTMVRLAADGDCFVAFGADPIATPTDLYLAAQCPEYFVVTPGTKVAALQASLAGNLYITPAL